MLWRYQWRDLRLDDVLTDLRFRIGVSWKWNRSEVYWPWNTVVYRYCPGQEEEERRKWWQWWRWHVSSSTSSWHLQTTATEKSQTLKDQSPDMQFMRWRRTENLLMPPSHFGHEMLVGNSELLWICHVKCLRTLLLTLWTVARILYLHIDRSPLYQLLSWMRPQLHMKLVDEIV